MPKASSKQNLAKSSKGNWKESSLGQICGQRKIHVDPKDSNGTIYVGLEHIDSGNPILYNFGNPSTVRSSKFQFKPNDILYGKLRPYLQKAVLSNSEGICSTDIIVLKSIKNKTIPKFLVYLLHTQGLIDHANRTTHGVNHPRTSWEALKKFNFPLPPLPEQRAIARVLSTISRSSFPA